VTFQGAGKCWCIKMLIMVLCALRTAFTEFVCRYSGLPRGTLDGTVNIGVIVVVGPVLYSVTVWRRWAF